jgi:hypothetical protein
VNRRQILAIFRAGGLATFAYITFAVTPATAQQPQDSDSSTVTPFVRNVTRVEGWSFFQPAEGGGDPTYSLLGNRATLGVRVDSRRLTIQGSLQYAQMIGLPGRSIGPGPLGPGPIFYVSAENSRAYQLYFKTLSLRLKNVVPRLSVEVGRMTYESGEHTPFAGRLIGNAEWSMFERAFDGARVDYDGPAWRVHGSLVMPTQGAFEESASPTIGRVQLTTVSASRSGWELFAHNYRDRRAIGGRPDNTGAREPRADIALQTVGSAIARAVAGVNVHLWGAIQRGDWYGDEHRALSASAEAGYRWPRFGAQPAISAGVLYASGDEDPNDSRHGTFFPMVPTTVPSVLAGTYALMNLRDVYVRGGVTPHDRLSLSAEVHRLSLVNRQDRWYSGTGATAFAGSYFGYSSRPSTLATGLGTFVQASVASSLSTNWRIAATAGYIRGGAVVRRQFAGRSLTVFVLENTVSLP